MCKGMKLLEEYHYWALNDLANNSKELIDMLKWWQGNKVNLFELLKKDDSRE